MKLVDPREGYDLFAPSYQKYHEHLDTFDWSNVRKILLNELDAAGNSGKRTVCLELGCGDGRVLKRLSQLAEERNISMEFHGWDISSKMLKIARQRMKGGAVFKEVDLGADELTGVFDLVLAFFLMVHIPDPFDFFKKIKPLVTIDGHFIFNNIPQRDGFLVKSAGHRFMIDFYHHEDWEIEESLTAAGFRIVEKVATEFSSIYITSIF